MNSTRTITRRANVSSAGLLLALAAAFTLLAGCGGGGPVGKVSGKVTADGKPVSGGTLVFSPLAESRDAAGPPTSVQVKEDGSYETSAANIGKNTVSYNPPSVKLPDGYVAKPSEPTPQSPFVGLVPEQKMIEVKAGDNTFEIKLIPVPPPPQ